MRFRKKKLDLIISTCNKYFPLVTTETICDFIDKTAVESGHLTAPVSTIRPDDIVATILLLLTDVCDTTYDKGNVMAMLLACISICKGSNNKQLKAIASEYTVIAKQLMD